MRLTIALAVLGACGGARPDPAGLPTSVFAVDAGFARVENTSPATEDERMTNEKFVVEAGDSWFCVDASGGSTCWRTAAECDSMRQKWLEQKNGQRVGACISQDRAACGVIHWRLKRPESHCEATFADCKQFVNGMLDTYPEDITAASVCQAK